MSIYVMKPSTKSLVAALLITGFMPVAPAFATQLNASMYLMPENPAVQEANFRNENDVDKVELKSIKKVRKLAIILRDETSQSQSPDRQNLNKDIKKLQRHMSLFKSQSDFHQHNKSVREAILANCRRLRSLTENLNLNKTALLLETNLLISNLNTLENRLDSTDEGLIAQDSNSTLKRQLAQKTRKPLAR